MYSLIQFLYNFVTALFHAVSDVTYLSLAFLLTGSKGTSSPGALRGMMNSPLKILFTFASCMALQEASLVGGSQLGHAQPLEGEEGAWRVVVYAL